MNITLSILKNYISIETISYFFSEIVLLCTIFLNLFLFLFFKKNNKISKISDYLTSCAFGLNSVLCCVLYVLNISNNQFYSSFLNNFLYIDSNIIFVKTIVNVFFMLFIFIVHKFTRKYGTRSVFANVYLGLFVLFSNIVINTNNSLLTLFVFDLAIIFLYKYSALFRFNIFKIFSLEYIILNAVASLIFYITSSLLFLNDSETQITILNNILFMALLLKVGIFPCVNYFSFKNRKNNIIYSMLLYIYLPFLSIICLTKIFDNWFLSGDEFFISVVIFLLFSVFNILIVAKKTKNIIRFLACCSYLFTIFAIIEFLVSLNINFTFKFASGFLFIQTAIFALLSIFKINNENKKLTMNNFKGLVKKNREYLFLLSAGILVLFLIAPSMHFKYSFDAIRNIYSYDKFGYILFVMFLAVYAVLVLRVFGIIINFYNYDYKNITDKFNKKTTLNYVAFWISFVLSFLFVF